MKNMYKIIAILITLIHLVSCTKEEQIPVDPSFILSYQRDGGTEAYAGTKFYVLPSGSGEFLTLFDGSEGHVWGEPGGKGEDLNKRDSLGVQYKHAGTYQLTLLATSTGNFGGEIAREAKTVEINVVDARNSFSLFYMNGQYGVFAPNNEIHFNIPDVTDLNLVPIFALESDASKVYVNGVEQKSGVTANNFSEPVVYNITSLTGAEQQYTVISTIFESSSEKALTKFVVGLGGYGEMAEIDEQNKIINLTANYNTTIGSVKLILVSSYASSIFINNATYSDRKKYNLSGSGSNPIETIKVIAQNKTESVYTLNTVFGSPLTNFTFAGLNPAPQGVIDDVAKTVLVEVLKGTDVSKLSALWTGTEGKVTIGDSVQTNGITMNNFVAPVTFTFYKGDIASDQYTITVNVK